MGQINVSKDFDATPDKLWETVSDPHTWEKWLTIHAGWLEEPPTTIEVGTKLVEKVVMLGMANKLEWVVESVEPGAELTIDGTGMAGVKSRFAFTLAPHGDGTTVTIDAAFEGAMIVGALGKAVEKDAVKNLGESLDKLADLAV